MKKLITVLVTMLLATATFAQNKNTIAVPAPKAVNLGDGSDWIPLFIQGVITSNFQQYSGMNVIDRQNADMVKAEQRLSENAAYDEKSAIELGKLTSARLIITGSIMAKSNAYALTFSITDAETGETKATSSIPNCLTSALEDGTAANQVSYDLMKGYGIKLSSEAQSKLTQTASVMSGESAAQASLANGIVAEQNGTNIEALTYYIQARKTDKKLGEATNRMANMTTVVTSGNYGANAKNLMKLRNDWDKLLREATELIASNPPEFELRYFSDIEALELTAQDYERGTMSFSVGAPYLKQVSGGENGKIARELLSGLHKIEQSKNWGDKINGFPWSYGDDIGGNNWLQKAAQAQWSNSYSIWEDGGSDSYSFTVSLLDDKKKTIAKKNVTLSVSYGKQYTGFEITSTNTAYLLTFSDVPVTDADTEKLYITVENTGSTSLSIIPVAEDVLPISRAIACINSGNHSGTVKIGGLLNITTNEIFIGVKSSARIFLDMSEMAVSVIRYHTFNRNRWLTGIVLPAGLQKIDSFAFVNCSSLESITLPDSLQRIDDNAFAYVPLTTVNYGGTMEQWNAMKKTCYEMSIR
ncbi:MAG: leucine-rich repeat protein [Treponema sp.]|nr:leucine-rich repeat protein [Treponema sp.]